MLTANKLFPIVKKVRVSAEEAKFYKRNKPLSVLAVCAKRRESMVLLKMESILMVKRLAQDSVQANNLMPAAAFSNSGNNLALSTLI